MSGALRIYPKFKPRYLSLSFMLLFFPGVLMTVEFIRFGQVKTYGFVYFFLGIFFLNLLAHLWIFYNQRIQRVFWDNQACTLILRTSAGDVVFRPGDPYQSTYIDSKELSRPGFFSGMQFFTIEKDRYKIILSNQHEEFGDLVSAFKNTHTEEIRSRWPIIYI